MTQSMIVRKSFKFSLRRIEDSQKNEELHNKLMAISNACKFVWNKSCYMNYSRLNNGYRIMNYFELAYWLSHLWKKSDEYSFLNECVNECLTTKLRDLDKAYKDCFKKVVGRRIPKAKHKTDVCGFKFYKIIVVNNTIRIPKIGVIEFNKHREIIGEPKNASFSYYCGRWYVAIQTEYEIEETAHPSDKMVAAHMGIINFTTLSDGKFYKSVNNYKKYEKKLASLQKALTRKQKDSKGWLENKEAIARVHAKIKNCRDDFIHKTSNEIVKNNAIVVLEKLNVRKMSKSDKGIPELNKRILDQGWHKFKTYIEYKQRELGGTVLYVNPAFDSQKCSNCGYIHEDNRRSYTEFCCINCKYETHADYNAAKNVLSDGHSQLADTDINVS